MGSCLNKKYFFVIVLLSQVLAASASVKGINILSADREQAERTILLAGADGLNHLQLSHRIVMNLCELRDSSKWALVRDLTAEAHGKGIAEVCVWDHALYDTDYYPAEYYYPGTGLLDLDKPGFGTGSLTITGS